MKTVTELSMRAPAQRIFDLAVEVERWPAFLPHYRWVTVLERKGNAKLVEMAASRDGFPVSWQAVEQWFPEVPRITFRHVRGVTRGMEVEWSFREDDGLTVVRITHELTLRWPLVGEWVATRVVGPQFVEHIARKTLRRIKEFAERPE